jgi:predicted porin
MKVTTIDSPEGTGETFSASDAAFSIAYAINLTDKFSIGFNPKFIYQSIDKMNASAVAVDLGVKYITPFDGIVLAMSISNFGNKMKLDGNATTVLHDVDPNTTGNNEKIPANLSTDEWALPLIYRVGVAYSFNFGTIHKFSMAVDALHPSDNYESINVGAEYAFNDFLFLRGGYKGLFLDDSEEKYTFGFGVKQQLLENVGIMVDYAYCDFGRLKNVQKFSVSVSF